MSRKLTPGACSPDGDLLPPLRRAKIIPSTSCSFLVPARRRGDLTPRRLPNTEATTDSLRNHRPPRGRHHHPLVHQPGAKSAVFCRSPCGSTLGACSNPGRRAASVHRRARATSSVADNAHNPTLHKEHTSPGRISPYDVVSRVEAGDGAGNQVTRKLRRSRSPHLSKSYPWRSR